MKKVFVSPLFCLAFLLGLPLSSVASLSAVASAKEEAIAKDKVDKQSSTADNHIYLDENFSELAEFIARLSAFDDDEKSPIHELNNQLENGNFIVLKKDVLKAFKRAHLVLAEYNDYFSDDELSRMQATMDELLDAVIKRCT